MGWEFLGIFAGSSPSNAQVVGKLAFFLRGWIYLAVRLNIYNIEDIELKLMVGSWKDDSISISFPKEI